MSAPGRGGLCLVEDDAIMGESLTDRLALEGIACDWHRDAGSALAALRSTRYAALVSDIRLPDGSGEDLFRTLIDEHIEPPPTLFITGFGAIDQAVRLLGLGARDYITKPFDVDELLDKLRAVAPTLINGDSWGEMEPVLGVSSAMLRIQRMLERVAAHSFQVMITGESGVGKEHAARYLHRCAERGAQQPFQALNCAAVTESLLEAELFGYEKGAFTGAVRAHPGVFERADGGTLLLDEVGDMPPAMQAKLLRVLQDGRVERIGSQRHREVAVRVVSATNRDLAAMVEAGSFREDLYYRLNLVHVHIPALRERREDIPWFARAFAADFSRRTGERRALSVAAEQHLLTQPWPGNVRELKHVVERACMLSDGPSIGPGDLAEPSVPTEHAGPPAGADLRTEVERFERAHIVSVLAQHGGQVARAAEALGISRKNLWEKMRKYRIGSG